MYRSEPSSAHAVWRCHVAWPIPGTVTVHGPGDNPLIVRMPMAMAMLMKTMPTTARMATQPACSPPISGMVVILSLDVWFPYFCPWKLRQSCQNGLVHLILWPQRRLYHP